MKNDAFLAKEDHFDRILAGTPAEIQRLFALSRYVRSESCFKGRRLVVYKMQGDKPLVLEVFEVSDFDCNEEEGASTTLTSLTTGKSLIVGYEPLQLSDHPVLVFLPLYTRTRWCADSEDAGVTGSLAFDLVIRTMSRYTPREQGIVHCETGTAYHFEFEATKTEA